MKPRRSTTFFNSDEQHLWFVSLVRWWCLAACWRVVAEKGMLITPACVENRLMQSEWKNNVARV